MEAQDTAKPKKSLYIHTFGCQMNEYDSLKLARILDRDYSPVDRPENADLVLINTCSVREKPEHKLFSLLGEMRELKRINPKMMIGVGGCVAQQEGKAITQRSRDVDIVFGTHNLSLVPSLLERRASSGEPQVAVDYRDEWEDMPIGLGAENAGETRVVAPISISRGCNKNCTYCIVPTTRGPEVSRSEDEILREVKISVHRGAREVLLLGQTVNSYGLDLKPRRSFSDLVENVARIEGVERIRFTSPHPQEVRQDFVDLMASTAKICRHIHMPLQSGSDRILKAMNRNYRREKYLKIIEALKAAIPEIAISTDIIVGFPGESEQDFEQTMEILNLVQFDSSFSFVFSPRPGTKAAGMEDLVPSEIKLERLQRLQSRQEELMTAKLKSYIGRNLEVLLDGMSQYDQTKLQGRISQNVLVHVDPAPVDAPDRDLNQRYKLGELVSVRISKANRHTLNGILTE